MARHVLVVDEDVDRLGSLASELRSRGLSVSLADDAASAAAGLRNRRADTIVVSRGLCPSVREMVAAHKTTLDVPILVLDSAAEGPDVVAPTDFDGIANRLFALRVEAPVAAAERGDFRGRLEQVSMPDLLQLLGMNQRTGTLGVTTPSGAGEVRLVQGRIVDAVYRRLEGEKALYRLLVEGEGTFAFAGGAPSPMKRVDLPMNTLLMEGLRQVDEVRERRARLVSDDDALLAVAAPADDAPDADRRVAEVLTAPLTLDELLDDVALPDLEVITAAARLVEAGIVRRVPRGALHAELAGSDRLAVLAALVRRLARPGFEGAPRMVMASTPQRLATVAHSVRRIANALAPAESLPAAPVPHVLATLRLGETDLDVVGLPVLDAYCPLWSLSLPGALAAVRLGSLASPALDEACAACEVPLLDAAEIAGDLDEADPAQMAGLITAALTMLAQT